MSEQPIGWTSEPVITTVDPGTGLVEYAPGPRVPVIAGDPIPLTPRELLDAGIDAGTLITTNRINTVLDRMRAEAPDGQLPEHIQRRLDAIAEARRP